MFGVTEIIVRCFYNFCRGSSLTIDSSTGLITESVSGNGGGLMMLGRSDGVLNRKYVSRSPAEPTTC